MYNRNKCTSKCGCFRYYRILCIEFGAGAETACFGDRPFQE